ncbi:MAG: ABC-type transport auxiliary lipoprotein family protein [Aquabacterium sp.]|nr:ABC-type transport auxiliary lipoprotein family protein [Aquabacterium sp.]
MKPITKPGTALGRRHLLLAASALSGAALGGCMSLGGSDPVPTLHHRLRDPGLAATPALTTPLRDALLVQALPGGTLVDTQAMAYARQPHVYAYYQHAFWTDRPLRQVPRLLQQRLQARGVATAVGLMGEPLRADWLLTVAVDSLHHDASSDPGVGRVGLTLELVDRRSRQRAARRSFTTDAPLPSADATGAAAALSQALARAFDEAVPWLEDTLTRLPATGTPRPPGSGAPG